jgi:tetratricopeptide (TPR) repeat protein
MLLVTHHPDPTKSRSQYLDLLKVAVKEDKDCPRNAFYYARELTYYGHHKEGIEALNRYLALPDAVWTTERCYAMRLLGKCYEELGDERAVKWYRMAVAECPETREPWMDLAMYAYRKSLWAECYGAAISALNITDKQINYTMDPMVWTERPYDLASIAAFRLGFKDQAIEFCKKALEFAPTDNRLLSNLELMNE